jgi:hypothetical protein
MTNYPVMFTFRDAVSGNGFLAGVTLSGRGLMVNEDDRWWVYGVRPGAIAECGQTPLEAFAKFRNRYKNVLFDIAAESNTFHSFRRDVEQFYYQPDAEEEKRWEEAFLALREGKLILEKPFCDLPRENPENRPSQITIARLDEIKRFRFTPTDNIPDKYVMAAAA